MKSPRQSWNRSPGSRCCVTRSLLSINIWTTTSVSSIPSNAYRMDCLAASRQISLKTSWLLSFIVMFTSNARPNSWQNKEYFCDDTAADEAKEKHGYCELVLHSQRRHSWKVGLSRFRLSAMPSDRSLALNGNFSLAPRIEAGLLLQCDNKSAVMGSMVAW